MCDYCRDVTNLLVHVQLPENLGRVEKVLVLEDLLRVPGK